MTGTGTVKMRPWPHQVNSGWKPEMGPPAANSKRSTAKYRHAAKRHNEGGNLEFGDGDALQIAAGQPNKNCRKCCQRPAIADCRIAHGEAVLHAALGHGCRHQSGEGQQRAHGKIYAGGEDHKGHADGEQAGDGHLAHDVEEVDRGQEARLHDGENRHEQKQKNQRREARQEGEGVEGPVVFF